MVVTLSTKMDMEVSCARSAIKASVTSTAAPPTTSGTPAAITDPNTRISTSAAMGNATVSARRRSLEVNFTMSA